MTDHTDPPILSGRVFNGDVGIRINRVIPILHDCFCQVDVGAVCKVGGCQGCIGIEIIWPAVRTFVIPNALNERLRLCTGSVGYHYLLYGLVSKRPLKLYYVMMSE